MARGLVRRESVETEMHKSEDSTKTFVYTKKKGYDVTRNPPLNKVSGDTCESFQPVSVTRLTLCFTCELLLSCAVGNITTLNSGYDCGKMLCSVISQFS